MFSNYSLPYALAISLTALSLCHCGRSLNGDRVWRDSISGGDEPQRYYLDLAANDYAVLEILQMGVDVQCEITDAVDQYRLSVDRPTGDKGLDWVPLFSPTPNRYTIEVRSIDQMSKKGDYEIKVTQRRKGTPEAEGRLKAAEWQYLYGYVYHDSSNPKTRENAFHALEKALLYYEKQGNPDRQADILHCMSRLLENQARYEDAIERNGQALVFYRGQGDLQEETKSLGDMGRYHFYLRDYEGALDFYFQALWLARETGNRPEEAKILNNISQVFHDTQKYGLCLTFLNQAWEIQEKSPLTRALILFSFAIAYDAMGELGLAPTYYFQALEAYQMLGRRADAVLRDVMLRLGDFFKGLGDFEQSDSWYRQAHDLAGSLDPRFKARFLRRMADLHLLRHEYASAIELYRQALESREYGTNGLIHFLLSITYFAFYLESGNFEYLDTAIGVIHQALEKREVQNSPRTKANLLYMLEMIHWKCGSLVEGTYLDEAKRLVEESRADILDSDLRQTLFAGRQVFYDLEIHIAMDRFEREKQPQHAGRALTVFEKKTARGLLDVVAEVPPYNPAAQDSHAVENFWTIKHHFPALRDKMGSGSDLDDCWDGVVPEPCNSDGSPLLPEDLLDAKAIQQLAGPDTLILNYLLGEHASFLWAVSEDEIRSYRLPSRAYIQDLVTKIRDHIKRPPGLRNEASVDEAMAMLSRCLLGPVFPLGRFKRLAIVSSDTLQLLPLAALPIPTGPENAASPPLVEAAEVVTIPSNSVLAAIRKKPSFQTLKPFAIFYDPVFNVKDNRLSHLPNLLRGNAGDDLSRLSLTKNEARKIVDLDVVPKDGIFEAEGFDANVQTALKSGLENYRIIHFATHGVIDTANPSRSKLVLSRYGPDGSRIEDALNLNAISSLKLHAELVVLSACDTAIGREIRGEGLISLGRGFMYAGVPRVVGSLWQVADQSTAELMAVFYKEILQEGLTPAAALREAQLSLRQHPKWKDPFYWSGFVLIGDWR